MQSSFCAQAVIVKRESGRNGIKGSKRDENNLLQLNCAAFFCELP